MFILSWALCRLATLPSSVSRLPSFPASLFPSLPPSEFATTPPAAPGPPLLCLYCGALSISHVAPLNTQHVWPTGMPCPGRFASRCFSNMSPSRLQAAAGAPKVRRRIHTTRWPE